MSEELISKEKVKIAPNSKESEMIVLGSMLTSINSLNIGADGLDDGDFYFTEHRIIFQTLKNAYRNDKPADVHLIGEELKRQDKLKAIGGLGYLTTLAQYAGTSAYIEEYIELVRDKSILRRMINAAQEVERGALNNPEDVHVLLDDAQAKFFLISQAANANAGVLIKDLLSGVKAPSQLPYLKELQERQERFQKKGPEELGITGIPTHFFDLDKLINGLGASNLTILAARPAMGKTALALNIAENVAFKNSLPVGIFSLEMTAEQLLHRMICSQSEVESDKIRTGSINGIEYQRVVAAVNSMMKGTVVIDDQPGLKITDLRARARRMKESHNIQLLVVDYLQLISGSGLSRSGENRQNEISEISRMMKTLARELDLPILCLSQLSRKVEERQGHRPMMSDLRESGCLTGDTLIQNAQTGTFHTIKELAERTEQTPIYVHAIDKDLKIGKHRMIKVFFSGKKKIFEMKTRSGRSIKASGNHPFLQLGGWVPLEKLKKRDRIGIPRQLKVENNKDKMKEEELILLAHLLGDGCILPNQPYHYTSADEENIDIVAKTSSKLFGIRPRLVKQENWFHLYLPSPIRVTHEKYHPITVWFSELGIERVRSYNKKMPGAVFENSEQKICLFLRHLWATDGNLSIKKLKGRKDAGAIYYSSSSPTLIKQTQQLLTRIGISSSIATIPSKKGYRDMYHLNIFGTVNQQRFLQNIGCAGKRGHLVPQLLMQLQQISSNPNNDVIPKEAWNTTIRKAKEKFQLSWREVCSGINTAYCGSSLFKNGISRKRMKSLYNVLPSRDLLALAESDVYWDEIMSIEELGIEDVYDATVENVHNFVANDILVHNSIEQDSDIVMFLLRREYYDPYDKPGMAELIVAKNRHGGVGSVNLTYRKELAQFVNYSPMSSSPSGPTDNDEAFAAFSP
jgi:replicative DNA helicase